MKPGHGRQMESRGGDEADVSGEHILFKKFLSFFTY